MNETRVLRNIPVWDCKAGQWVEIDLDIEVDVYRVAHQLAPKAYNNKKHKTRLIGGLIEVRMRGTKATPMREKETA